MISEKFNIKNQLRRRGRIFQAAKAAGRLDKQQ